MFAKRVVHLLLVAAMAAAMPGCNRNDDQPDTPAPGKSATADSPGDKTALVLYAENDAAPWSKPDGTGYANDLVKALYNAAGVKVELKVAPYSRCKHLVVQGDAVGCFNMARIPELSDTIDFPKAPLFMEYISYFHNLAKPLAVTREKDIPKGTRVGTVIGYEYADLFYELKDKGVLVAEETRSENVNLKKLAAGRIDATILVHNETKLDAMLIAKAGVTGKVSLAFRCATLELHIGFSRAHPQGQWALEKYEEGMKIIKSNGTYDRITTQWADKAMAMVPDTNGK